MKFSKLNRAAMPIRTRTELTDCRERGFVPNLATGFMGYFAEMPNDPIMRVTHHELPSFVVDWERIYRVAANVTAPLVIFVGLRVNEFAVADYRSLYDGLLEYHETFTMPIESCVTQTIFLSFTM